MRYYGSKKTAGIHEMQCPIKAGFLAVLFGIMFLWSGCCGPDLGPMPQPLSRAEAIGKYNENVSAVEPFKASIFDWEAEFVDENGKRQHHQHLGGRIYFVPSESVDLPSSFYLMTKALDDALVVASNEEEFWMYIKPDKRGWWGKYEHRGKECAERMMIDPQVFLEFIGLKPLPTGPIYPAYKIVGGDMILEYVELSDMGYHVVREVIIDRRDNRPREINTYNRDGKRLMQGRLSEYTQLGEGWIPKEILISTAARNFKFQIKLWGFKELDRNDRRVGLLLRRPKRISGIESYTQIDEKCDMEDGM